MRARGSRVPRSTGCSTARSSWARSTLWRCTSSSRTASPSGPRRAALPELPEAPLGRASPSPSGYAPSSSSTSSARSGDPAGASRAGRACSSWRSRSALAFIVPIFDNLDVAFQGFNTWHSLQYLALTWFILSREAETADRQRASSARSAGTSHTPIFYALDDRRDAARRASSTWSSGRASTSPQDSATTWWSCRSCWSTTSTTTSSSATSAPSSGRRPGPRAAARGERTYRPSSS